MFMIGSVNAAINIVGDNQGSLDFSHFHLLNIDFDRHRWRGKHLHSVYFTHAVLNRPHVYVLVSFRIKVQAS